MENICSLKKLKDKRERERKKTMVSNSIVFGMKQNFLSSHCVMPVLVRHIEKKAPIQTFPFQQWGDI